MLFIFHRIVNHTWSLCCIVQTLVFGQYLKSKHKISCQFWYWTSGLLVEKKFIDHVLLVFNILWTWFNYNIVLHLTQQFKSVTSAALSSDSQSLLSSLTSCPDSGLNIKSFLPHFLQCVRNKSMKTYLIFLAFCSNLYLVLPPVLPNVNVFYMNQVHFIDIFTKPLRCYNAWRVDSLGLSISCL